MGLPNVRLPDVTLADGTRLAFEVRFGSAAVSKHMPTPPDSRIIQVNLNSGMTRVVVESLPERELGQPQPQPLLPQQWRRHFVGDREFWRWTGTDPATGRWYSKAEKDASIRFEAPTAAEGVVVLPDKDESDSPANRAWFDSQF